MTTEFEDDSKGRQETNTEAWWNAVLQDERRYSPPGRHSSGHHPHGDRGNAHGAPEDWVWARELYDGDECIELPVVGYNRGGVLVEARSLRGFVPVSHLIALLQAHSEIERAESMNSLVGKKLQLKVIEFDPERGRLVFSERAAMAGPGKRLELLSGLEVGQIISGVVTNITRFGVFVDLGGVEGLIHVSELSWGRVRHPSDVVNVGEKLEVQVLSVDQEQGRVGLSLRELLPDPWKMVEERYNVGDVVEGAVTNVVKFGAFVAVEDGLEGLIHVSELGDGHFLHPRSVIQEGEQVRARIMHIDAASRRLGLSLRQVSQYPQQEENDSELSTEMEEAFPSA
ncbi:MAG: S1 RNA-binding domain-containing protein [Anaerolineales bacterium]